MEKVAQKESSSEGTLLPILVNEDKDLTCYLAVKSDAEAVPTAKFVTNNPSALKVFTNIYKTIEDTTESAAMIQMDNLLTIFFRPEFFDPQLKPSDLKYENDTAGKGHFLELLHSLPDYSPKPFENFYWTAPESREFYATHQGSARFAADRKRAQRWSELAGYFEAMLGDADQCHFADLADQAVLQPV